MNLKYLRSGPAPDATVSLTVRIATLYVEYAGLSAPTFIDMVLCVTLSRFDGNKLFPGANPLISDINIADTRVPQGISFPDGGNSNNAFADFILRSRLLL